MSTSSIAIILVIAQADLGLVDYKVVASEIMYVLRRPDYAANRFRFGGPVRPQFPDSFPFWELLGRSQ